MARPGREAMTVSAATGHVGVCNTAPQCALDVNVSGQAPPTAVNSTALNVVGNASLRFVTFDIAGSNGATIYRRTNGSFASPAALAAEDVIGTLAGQGYTGSGYSSTQIYTQFRAEENWSAGAQGTYFALALTKSGTTTIAEGMRVWSDGRLQPQGALVDKSYSYQTPATGFAITIADACGLLVLDPSGTLAAGTVTLPAARRTVSACRIASTRIVTLLTLLPNSGQSIAGALATIAANGSAEYLYRAANATWYRIG